jgi:hypothetical protein
MEKPLHARTFAPSHFRALLAFLLIAAACERPPENDADELADDTTAVDTSAAGDGATMEGGALVDANSVRVGDQIAGVRVATKKIQSAPASPLGVTGSLSFEGEIELTGSYRAHFDYPEVRAPCFWVDVQEWEKLPRVKGDQRLKWFCFQNDQDAVRQLGALGTETRATIIINNYTTNLEQTDAWDTARLVRVVTKAP